MFSSTLVNCADGRFGPVSPTGANIFFPMSVEGRLADHAPSPLDVLLSTMHLRWQEGKLDEAVALAKAAAPYLHAKAATADGRGALDPGTLRDAQLDELCARLYQVAAGGSGDEEPSEEEP